MNKTTKGTLAATAAVALLASGAGTLAFWNANAVTPGTIVPTGELKLVDGTGAAACAAQSWTFENGAAFVTGGGSRLVPGDSISKTCTFTITARGTNLVADLDVIDPTLSTNTNVPFTATGSYVVGTTPNQAQITSADNTKQLKATITVDFPYGSTVDNLSQASNRTVGPYTVTATQLDPTP